MLGLFFSLLCAAPWQASEQPGGASVVIPHTQQYEVKSKQGLAYRIMVAAPQTPAPPTGFPVIYLLDGNAFFGTIVETYRIQQRFLMPAVIVAIGYPTDVPFDASRRYYDLTPKTPDDLLKQLPSTTQGPLPKTGGQENSSSSSKRK
ncbi:MAG: hypothetical protein QM703_15830 [Gemmatales bacterium]